MFILDRQRILAIAKDYASRNGLVVYADYNRYLRELIRHRKLDPVDAGWYIWDIKRILLDESNTPGDRYFTGKVGNKTCFYPLSSRLIDEEKKPEQGGLLST